MHSLIPAPSSFTATGSTLRLDAATSVSSSPELAGARRWFVGALGAATGWDLASAADATITFALDPTVDPEGYTLTIDTAVRITASDNAGAMYGAQTLRQLLGPAALRQAPTASSFELPTAVITDGPRFSYRGVMLDVARHFIPKNDVLRFIDVVAAHKLNVLHLHLTDDQGWRVEIRKYPRLTEVGAWRKESNLGAWRAGIFDATPHGGFYTQEDLREIVAFAAARNITVIPEIDVPGHSQAAIAAYPELGLPGKPLEVWTRWGINENVLEPTAYAVQFYKDVLDEVMDIFPSPWISLGGDEVPLDQWNASPFALQAAADLGYDSVAGLHGWFVGQLAKHLHQHGRKSGVWDEIGDVGLPDGALVASWRGYEGGLDALAKGYDVVMCPEHKLYLDHRQSALDEEPVPVGYVTTLEAVYNFDPMPDADGRDFPGRLLGAQANIWTEHLPSARRIDYAAFPRLSAIAEVFWSNPDTRDYADFDARLSPAHLDRLSAMGVEFRPLDGPLPWQQRPGVVGWKRDYEQEQAALAAAAQ
ncbi:beta-N-acetylhexosaminidase [Arthrobacter alpinus]|uniref:beta-N-acetylhexosaminidase n=1 Tax=Arthrobacter alpinus TaxID=656366 RepID=UPI0005C9506A|nr:beta-N-acetylhexosaminidase [Arthrobacter alpinus]ALV44851.1 beta-N-acetylhexosaminidase [Arthrobacter alpinus]